MEHKYKQEMIQALNARLKSGAFNNRAVFLFGHCNATEEMADYLLERGVAPTAILDNSASKQGGAYREIPISPPETVQMDNSAVLIATRFFEDMFAQLRSLGYTGEIVRVVEYNSFKEYSLTEETFNQKADRVRRGVKTLGSIREKYPARHLVLCPYSALGDVYWAMAFLPAYCKKNSISETAVILTGDGCRQVAGLFGLGDAVQLTAKEMDELMQAIIFTRDDNGIIAHHDRPYTDNIIHCLGGRFLSYIDYYRRAVYGLPRDTSPAIPGVSQAAEAPQGMAEGRSVILAPYAKSVVQPPKAFWEELASEWLSKGYFIYTSVTCDEQPVKGTTPLALPLAQIKNAAEYAGVFIGLRSGLCDILFDAKCRKIVVFPDCFYSATPHKVADFFALPGWERIIAL